MQNKPNALLRFYYSISMNYRNIVAALSGALRIDAGGLDPDPGKPGLEVSCDELWPAAFQEERIESFQDFRIAHSRLHKNA